jgi:uncharacterized protein
VTHSALYEGTVRHRRFRVRGHEFRHSLALAYLDLDELPHLLGGRLVRRRPGLVRFRREDYLPGAPGALADAVRELVGQRTGRTPAGPVRVLTQLRSFGHCFNPVSFAYCFDTEERVQAIVSEVTNTPWGERRAYVLERDREGRVLGGTFSKELHVSPFMAMDQRYRWRATEPGPTVSIHIESEQDGERAFDATLALRRRPLTRRSLAGVTARYPAASMRVLALIYGHALRLKLKGVPLHPNPAR